MNVSYFYYVFIEGEKNTMGELQTHSEL